MPQVSVKMPSPENPKRSLASRLQFFSKRDGGEKSSEEDDQKAPKWSFGVLNDKETFEVPGKPLTPTISYANFPMNISSDFKRYLETNTSQALYSCCPITKMSP